MSTIPTTASDISAEWLTEQLVATGHLHTGTVTHLTYAPFDSHATAVLALDVTYSTNAHPSLTNRFICKLYNGEQFWDGFGELLFYTKLAPQMQPFAISTLFASALNMDQQASYLLMHDVRTTHHISTGAPLTFQQYQQCVDALVQLHAHWWEHPELESRPFANPRGGPLRMVQVMEAQKMQHNAMQLREQFPTRLDNLANALSHEQRDLCRLIAYNWFDLFIERASSGAQTTMIHGDFHHFGNICLPIDPSADICILDWETWKRSIGVYDLAYMLAYQKDRKQLEHLLLAQYHHGLVGQGIKYSWKQCVLDYRLSLMACVFPPLLMWANADALAMALNANIEWENAHLLA